MTTAVAAQTSDDRVVTVVLDRAHARFFELTAAGTVELTSLRSPAMRGGRFHSDRQGGPGWGEHAYHDRIREEQKRHYGAIAEQLERLRRTHGVTGFVLAGPDDTGAMLQRTLPPALAECVIGTARLNPTEVTDAIVQATAAPLLEQHRLNVERNVLAAMLEGLGTGRAENGTRAVLRALAKGQVRVLLVRKDAQETGFRCTKSGRLVPSPADCLGEGEPIPVSDVVAEASAEARRQGATVTVIRDPEAVKAVETLGALLRFG